MNNIKKKTEKEVITDQTIFGDVINNVFDKEIDSFKDFEEEWNSYDDLDPFSDLERVEKNSILKRNTDNTSKSSAVNYSKEAHKIINDFMEYQSDLVKMMQNPLLANLEDTEVKKFSFLCEDIRLSEVEDNHISREMYLNLRNEFASLISYSHKVKLTDFNDMERRKINDARVCLSKALDESSSNNERLMSTKALLSKLTGVLPVSENVFNEFKIKYNLLEIEA